MWPVKDKASAESCLWPSPVLFALHGCRSPSCICRSQLQGGFLIRSVTSLLVAEGRGLSTKHVVSETALCRTSLVSAGSGLAGRVIMAFSFSPQVPRRRGTSPRTAPAVSTCRACPSCYWLSAVCKGLQLSPSPAPAPSFLACRLLPTCPPQASKQPRCCPGSCFLL